MISNQTIWNQLLRAVSEAAHYWLYYDTEQQQQQQHVKQWTLDNVMIWISAKQNQWFQ